MTLKAIVPLSDNPFVKLPARLIKPATPGSDPRSYTTPRGMIMNIGRSQVALVASILEGITAWEVG
jgi:hypothetical protein